MSYNTRKMGGTTGARPALKGNLALKSSPLNPSSGKGVTQELVVDHMNAHYRKLLNAKSAIDASVPRAYASSQKVRDRHTRNEILSNGKRSASAGARRPMNGRGSRPSSARHSRPGSARNAGGTRKQLDTQAVEPFKLDDIDYENFTQDEINCINAMVNDTIDSERLDRVLNGGTLQEQPKGVGTARSAGSGSGGQRTSRGMVNAMNMNTLQRKNMSADILEKRTHVFTEPKDSFTPRTLRNSKYKDIPSKLSQTKHFRPAKKASSPVNGQGPYAQSASESEILDETLMSRDFATRMTMSGEVPKLDISIDQDHMKWLQDQSARKESKSYRPLEEELAVTRHERVPSRSSAYTRSKIKKEEEELSYLDFITEVTNDVLTRGIFTNRVLCNVFEEHVQKNKAKLDEDRMRGMLDNLRDDLGIDSHEPFRENPEDVGMGSSRPPVRSKTKTTGYTGDASQFRTVRVGSRDGEKGKASGDVIDSYRHLGGEQRAELQSLTDIAEVSEKTASVSSIKSSSRKVAPDTPSKEMDDALIDLLGLEDVPDISMHTLVPIRTSKAEKPSADTFSLKSTLSSHPSEQAYKQSSDPLQDYATKITLENSDKASVGSAASKSSKTSTLRGNNSDLSQEQPSNGLATTSKPISRKKSIESSSKASSDTPYVTMVRKSSVDSTGRSTLSHKSSADAVSGEQRSTVLSRQSSKESVSKSSAGISDTKTTNSVPRSNPSTVRTGSDEGDDLESNAAFGKTTLFGKTQRLTYKALSQASDEDYSDNFSDKAYDDDDGAF